MITSYINLKRLFVQTIYLWIYIYKKKYLCDEAVKNGWVCKISKIKRKPYNTVRASASKPLQMINADIMVPIRFVTFLKSYKFISVFIDNHSRLALAHSLRSKSGTGQCFKAFIISSQSLRGQDHKFWCLETDQGTSFTGCYTRIELGKLDVQLEFGYGSSAKNICT